jgi:hypothetical protein
MGAWQEVATMGKTRMMHRGKTRGAREGRRGKVSGQRSTRKSAEWISGSGVAEQSIEREADPTVERRQPSIIMSLRARCQAAP